MATRYKLYTDCPNLGPINAIQRTLDDGTITSIPMAVGNTDYQEYLEWVAAGNTPEAAD
jgi:hypothetical protein